MTYNRELLVYELSRDEDVRIKPYKDSVGKLTIGVGRNLDDKGLSKAEINILLNNDINDCEADLDREMPWWRKLTDNRQRVMLNMCFNLGITRLKGFESMLRDVQNGLYDQAAVEMLDSLWARQVGGRAVRLAKMMKNG